MAAFPSHCYGDKQNKDNTNHNRRYQYVMPEAPQGRTIEGGTLSIAAKRRVKTETWWVYKLERLVVRRRSITYKVRANISASKLRLYIDAEGSVWDFNPKLLVVGDSDAEEKRKEKLPNTIAQLVLPALDTDVRFAMVYVPDQEFQTTKVTIEDRRGNRVREDEDPSGRRNSAKVRLGNTFVLTYDISVGMPNHFWFTYVSAEIMEIKSTEEEEEEK